MLHSFPSSLPAVPINPAESAERISSSPLSQPVGIVIIVTPSGARPTAVYISTIVHTA